jgi:2-oxoglutarate dehydrogenase E2 component (dihydrolipoamide succinyltransferase)
MKEKVLVPSVGESITQGTLTSWLKKEGEKVEEGEELFELETDKATVAVPAPAAGALHILVQGGSDVEIGQVVGELETAPEEGAGGKKAPAAARRGPQAAAPSPATAKAGAAPARPADAGRVPPAAAPSEKAAAPSAQRQAPLKEKEPPAVPGETGPAPAAPPPQAEAPLRADARETREPMSRLRRTLAARLVQARQQTALLTTFNEVDMGAVLDLRKRTAETFESRYGVRLGLMSFFVRASCQALREFPRVNSRIEGEEIVTCRYYDLGIAVSTERGLVVPVLRDADRMSFAGIERSLQELALKAREKKITLEELAGGTFTITNGGVFGSLLSTPLPNYPQPAILGMHAIQRRPVARGEQVVIRPMMYLALSYDHRLIDGREAVQFLGKVKLLVEEPERLLLDT